MIEIGLMAIVMVACFLFCCRRLTPKIDFRDAFPKDAP